MKQFLLVSTRPDEEALDSEYQAYLRATGLKAEQLELAEFDLVGLPDIAPQNYAGVFIAGSPYGAASEDGYVPATQQWVRSELEVLFKKLLEADVPILATGAATNILAGILGSEVSPEHAEFGEVVDIELDREAQEDPVFSVLPRVFPAYVNHSDGLDKLPEGAVRLAWSLNTPVQAVRFSPNVYAVQFNPDLNAEAIMVQIEAFIDAGDLGLADAETLVSVGRYDRGDHGAGSVLRSFAQHFGK